MVNVLDQPTGEVCYENIGPKERARRAQGGYVMVGAALVLAAILVGLGAPWWSRLIVFLPFWAGISGWLQARERT